MTSITDDYSRLESEVKKLKEELATSSASHSQKEEVLQKQLRDAHAAQRDAEAKLEAEQHVTEKYRNDAIQLQEKISSQYLEITRLQSQLLMAERERDEAIAGKVAAEESHGATKANISSTLFDFYLHSVLSRGSLSFLGPKYEITLVEVWEAVLDMFGGAGYTEADLEALYLDDEACTTLARGKEQLVRDRAEVAGEERLEKAPLTYPAHLPVSVDPDIIGSSSYSPPPARAEVKTTTTEPPTVQDEEKTQDDIEAEKFEIEVIKPTSPGNFDVDPGQADYLLASPEFDEFLADYLSLDEPISSLFSENTDFNFFSSVAEVPRATQTSPLSAIPPPSLQITAASQPGSQEEQIGALQGLDDPLASQEQKVGELEEGEKTPEPYDDDTKLFALISPGSESSSKKKGKRAISKKKKKSASTDEDKVEEDPTTPSSPSSPTRRRRIQKLIIKPGKSSKGGGKKER